MSLLVTRNLRRMMQFAELFPDLRIVSALTTQLSWSHFLALLPLKTQAARSFFTENRPRKLIGEARKGQAIYSIQSSR